MVPLTFITSFLTKEIIAATARDRWQGMQQMHSSSTSSGWLTTAMVIVLVVSAVTLVVVTLIRKIGEWKASKRELLLNAAKTRPIDSSAMNSSALRAKIVSARGEAFIAVFPFIRKFSLENVGQEPTQQGGGGPPPEGAATEYGRQLPKFVSATVTGLSGRVVFFETTLAVNVGDRVLVVVGSPDVSKNTDSIEEVGLVQQSTQPAEFVKAPNAHRLAVELSGLSEVQIAQLAAFITGAKATETAKVSQNTQTVQEKS